MKPTLLIALGVFLLGLSIHSRAADDQWELELDNDGIRVYTQIEGDSPYKQVKVTATINASMDEVMKVLLAFGGYKNWMNKVQESYLLNQTDGAYYVFLLEDAAWPMQNRYQVSRLDVEQSHQTSSMKFRSVPNYIDKRKDAIQIKQYEGSWSLENRDNHQCFLELILIHHPGGHVPPWLANFHAVENPYQSVVNLKSLVEQSSIRP